MPGPRSARGARRRDRCSKQGGCAEGGGSWSSPRTAAFWMGAWAPGRRCYQKPRIIRYAAPMPGPRRIRPLLVGAAAFLLVASPALATGYHDPVVPLLLTLTVVLASAKIGGWLAVRVRQPAVLGELVAGILIGNL